mmetsp:Transcript_12852/g.23101  ORF Transcript_12852/g.23101 Transcript_12852/m.23101 type:complete len:248 (-) Transcript_12852:240-983(-)
MGRSQVQRNRARGRPGQGGRGRGGGSGRGSGSDSGGRGSSSSSSTRRHKGGVDPCKLGSNDFRYERSTSNTSGGGGDNRYSHYDGLLDDINFMPTGGLGEYYGDSHIGMEEEDLAVATLSATAALKTSSSIGDQTNNSEDWMSIDVKSLDKCLQQIPIHERLKLPHHIGKHLENSYGGGKGGGRKKTLAELREEVEFAHVEDEPNNIEKEEENVTNTMQDGNMNNDESDADEDEDEDLDAWLDDMIA